MRRLFLTLSAMALILILPSLSSASEGFEDLVKVVRSGVTEQAVLTYINESPMVYDLSVDEILYLRDLGLSPEVITAVVEHGKTVAVKPPVTNQTEEEEAMPEESAEPEPDQPPQGTAAPEPGPPEPVTNGVSASPDVVQEHIVDAPVVTVPAQDVSDYSTFYDSLSPYGTWIDADGVWCWQPTAVLVVRGWRPYCHGGNWIYTDYGWMWQSSYSWGWAPYHYGRWRQHHRHGWIWQPDSVWAPAWVSWRQCDTAIGWAPLPPEACFAPDTGFTYLGRSADADCEFGLEFRHYAFVPVLDFCSPSVARHSLAPSYAGRLFGATVVIRNGVIFSGNRLIDQGPLFDRIRERTHLDIRQVRVVDSAVRPGGRIVSGIIAGESVSMFRPRVVPSARETPAAVITRRQVNTELRRQIANPEAAINMYRSSSETRTEQIRGLTSLWAARRSAAAGNPPPATSPRAAIAISRDTDQQNKALLSAARRRQTEEAAEQQRQGERQRAETFVRNQELQRQQALETQKQQAVVDQQHQVEQATRDQAQRQAEQQHRVEQAVRQQAQHQAEQRAQVQEQQKQIQEVVQRRQEQLKAFQVQRQTEETAERLKDSRQQQVEEAARQQSGFHGYENRSATSSASSRGSASRNRGENDR